MTNWTKKCSNCGLPITTNDGMCNCNSKTTGGFNYGTTRRNN